jgi:hypothetical protein
MVRFLVLSIALLTVVAVAITLLITALIFLAFACLIGIPLWLTARSHLQKRGIMVHPSPVERLKSLYAEGKIDMFEFEKRVEKLISVGH